MTDHSNINPNLCKKYFGKNLYDIRLIFRIFLQFDAIKEIRNKDDVVWQYLWVLVSPLERCRDINIVTGELYKLITLQIIFIKKTYSPEECDDFKLTITECGMRMLKNQCHK